MSTIVILLFRPFFSPTDLQPRMKSHLQVLIVVIMTFVQAESIADSTIDYNRDIRPILSENCLPCHGFDEKARQAELRLDVMDSAYADRNGTTAILPTSASRAKY